MSASETVHPRCQGEESFFGRLKLEYPRLKKKHGIRWIDIQRPLLLEPCVDYKLTKPCIRVNLFFLGGTSLSRPTSVWQRTYSPFAFCKNVQPILEF